MLDPNYIEMSFDELTASSEFDQMVGKFMFNWDETKVYDCKLHIQNLLYPFVSFDCDMEGYKRNTRVLFQRSEFTGFENQQYFIFVPYLKINIQIYLPILNSFTLDSSYATIDYKELYNNSAYAGLNCYIVMNDDQQFPIEGKFELNDGNPLIKIISKNRHFKQGSLLEVVKSNCLIAQYKYPNSMHEEIYATYQLEAQKNQFQIYLPRVYLNN